MGSDSPPSPTNEFPILVNFACNLYSVLRLADMSERFRLILRRVKAALERHCPDEAQRLLGPLLGRGHPRVLNLAISAARQYVARANQRLDQNDVEGAWQDLISAEALNTGDRSVTELRHNLTRLGLTTTRAMLEAGNLTEVIVSVDRLRGWGVQNLELVSLEKCAQKWLNAIECADRGDFAQALCLVDRIRPVLPCPPTGLDHFSQELVRRKERYREAVNKLHDAADRRDWRRVVWAADEVLAIAPEHQEAKVVRRQAWEATLARGVDEQRPILPSTMNSTVTFRPPAGQTLSAGEGTSADGGPNPVAIPKQFLLWVDGVGGYLVCLSNRVTLGQATSDARADIPLCADVSRLHAEISRDDEGYILQSSGRVTINRQEVKRQILAPDDLVTLGTTSQFVFRKPLAVSGTACLEITSGHRLSVPVDAVVLMANELLLGPRGKAHIWLRDLREPLSIYRSREGLGIRVPSEPFFVNNRECTERALLTIPCHVHGSKFSFSLDRFTGR